jgi:hypothetical protein
MVKFIVTVQATSDISKEIFFMKKRYMHQVAVKSALSIKSNSLNAYIINGKHSSQTMI